MAVGCSDGWMDVGVRGCWSERGEGRQSSCCCDVTQPADWRSSRLQAQSVASSSSRGSSSWGRGGGGGEEHLIHFFYSLLRLLSPPGQAEQKTDNCMIRGASSPSSRLQKKQNKKKIPRLAWCSVQPASLCGRAVHVSEEPLSNPGLGEASAFFCIFFSFFLFFVIFFFNYFFLNNPSECADRQQHPCQPHCAAWTRSSSEEHHRRGSLVTRRRLSAPSSWTGSRGAIDDLLSIKIGYNVAHHGQHVGDGIAFLGIVA